MQDVFDLMQRALDAQRFLIVCTESPVPRGFIFTEEAISKWGNGLDRPGMQAVAIGPATEDEARAQCEMLRVTFNPKLGYFTKVIAE